MSYSLGFDGGGSKTACAVLDAEGGVAGEGTGGPSNPLRCGYEAAFHSLSDAAAGALKAAGIAPGDITAVCAGLAGAGRRSVVERTLQFLAQEFPKAVAHVTPDYEVALEAAAGAGPGVVLVAGTGSVAFGRNGRGETAHAGGYGPWLGDEGSAFDMGRRAVAAASRTRDLAAPPTVLTEKILRALKCPDWDELEERIAANPDAIFPRLFPVVAAAADGEDDAAKEIVFTAAIGLGNLAMMVVRRLDLKSQKFPLAKCGGVFGQSRMLDTLLDSVLASGALHAKISRLHVSPAVGAARMAIRSSKTSGQGVSSVPTK